MRLWSGCAGVTIDMPTRDTTLQGVVVGLIIAVLSSLGTIGVPLFWKWLTKRVENAEKREQAEDESDTKENVLDLETREITNKLALESFDERARRTRIEAEYAEQSKLVKSQSDNIVRLGADLANCRDVQVPEYKRQVDMLLKQLDEKDRVDEQRQTLIEEQAEAIRLLRIDNQILSSFNDIDKDKDK